MRVMIVDDSRVCRAALRALLEADPELEVVAEAADGKEAIALLDSASPSLLLLDLRMPGMSGHELLDWLVRHRPTPVVLMTGEPGYDGPGSTFAALSRGALDLIPKSSEWRAGTPEAQRLIAHLKALMREVRSAPPLPSSPATALPRAPGSRRGWVPQLVGLGASTGGPAALASILRELPASFPAPVLIAQHLDGEFFDGFVQWLSRASALPVRVARDGELVAPGQVRVAPPGAQLRVLPGGRLRLEAAVPGTPHAPSVDVLFRSMAESVGARAAAALLTGMGADGAAGLKALREAGAATAAQDRDSSAVYGMPRRAVELSAAEVVLPLGAIPYWLTHFEEAVTAEKEALKMAKILIVDDSHVVLEARRMLLEDAGYEVVTLDNPLSVAAAMRRELPNLVLLDVNMPAVSGDVIARIVSQYGHLGTAKVVLHSDRSAQELQTRAQACGAAGFLQKTEDEDAFLEGVRKFLG